MLHTYLTPISHLKLPKKFTNPFGYTPHPLCMLAAEEVKHYLSCQPAWQSELSKGKMFGVLVVQTSGGEVGYLAAFSGILAGKSIHPFFVPPVYDLLQPQGFFKVEEEQISAINLRLKALEESEDYRTLATRLEQVRQTTQVALNRAKEKMKHDKQQRQAQRLAQPLPPHEEEALIRQSQFQKAQYKRLESACKDQLTYLQDLLSIYERPIQALKEERKSRSATLQRKIFQQYRMLNYRGEEKDLCQIFEQTVHKTPPAGAGECAAPKLLQYAYLNHLKPLAMAEFWWGDSPRTEIRRHGQYYPACKGKCEPILQHTLQGLEVDENPLLKQMQLIRQPDIVYEDPWLVVLHKPAGLLSVPGKEEAVSVYSLMRQRYPTAHGPLMVHRLDMDTSGLLIVAKTKQVHQQLQALFKEQLVRKRYIALLDGVVEQEQGTIELPLRPDPLDRPRQVVDPQQGKPAVTRYQVLARTDGRTRIAFYPLTGRTHQLRVHAAHPLGLHCPIVGDRLYGREAERLYLHAESLEFTHPITQAVIVITREADF